MATASVTNTLVNGSTPLASVWNTNYQDLVDFLNNDVLHLDGAKTMTGNLKLGTSTLDFNGTAYSFGAYTPVLTASGGGWQINNGTNDGRYARLGGLVIVQFRFVWGSTTNSGSGLYTMTPPVIHRSGATDGAVLGTWSAVDVSDGSRVYTGPIRRVTSSQVRFDRDGVSGGGVGATTPFSFANTDQIDGLMIYEAN